MRDVITTIQLWQFITSSLTVTEDRVKLKIAYDDWLSEKKRREEIKLAVVKAEKAAKKLEEEKRYVKHKI